MKRVRLIRERVKRGFTQEFVAKNVGYKTQSAVSDIENGKLEPSLSAMKSWADLFGMTVDELFFSDEDCKMQYPTSHSTHTTSSA